jgi:tetratricopeptide (TPR) repeat protein
VIEIKRKNFGEEHLEYANALNNLSATLEKLGEYKEAKEGYLKVLEIKINIFGE